MNDTGLTPVPPREMMFEETDHHVRGVPPSLASAIPARSYEITWPVTWTTPRIFTAWEVDQDRFELVKMVGKGMYGAVAQARDHLTGKMVGIKRISPVFGSHIPFDHTKRIYREVQILSQLKHSNIISLLHICQPPNLSTYEDLYVVFDFLDSDLKDLFLKSELTLSEYHVKWFMYQLFLGMAACHAGGVMHRDIKPANVLITERCDLKICDFGLARLLGMEGPAPPSSTALPSQQGSSGGARAAGELQESFPRGGADTEEDRAMMGLADPRARDVPKHERASLLALEHAQAGQEVRSKTLHVQTRWYRAPELPLYHDGAYTPAIDVWSVGCIFGEFCGTLGDLPPGKRRGAMFPGGYSYESPTGTSRVGQNEKKSQLRTICEVMGCPSAEVRASISRESQEAGALLEMAINHPSKLPDDPAVPLGVRFPYASSHMLDLLKKCLAFEPRERISAQQALQHPWFLEVRREDAEAATQSGTYVRFPEEPTPENIRRLMGEIIRKFNTSVPPNWLELSKASP